MTGYRPLTDIQFSDLFGEALAPFGVREHVTIGGIWAAI
jgi:hypothetical protein